MRTIAALSSCYFSTCQTKILKVRFVSIFLVLYLCDGYVVNEGDRIAQLIIERIYTPEVLEVQVRHPSHALRSWCHVRFL